MKVVIRSPYNNRIKPTTLSQFSFSHFSMEKTASTATRTVAAYTERYTVDGVTVNSTAKTSHKRGTLGEKYLYGVPMKRYVLIFTTLIFLSMMRPQSICEVNVKVLNNSNETVKIIMLWSDNILFIKPGFEKVISQENENAFEIHTSSQKYSLGYGEYDHWFTTTHNELITITENEIIQTGQMHWSITEIQ